MQQPDVDVLIVGAGLSGICAAHHLQTSCPGKSYAILEAREASGGTWDLFRYPGIRSDSDMFTLGYSFRPWTGPKAIAEGASILAYVRDTAREAGIDRHIRYGLRVERASWSSESARWTVTVREVGSGEQRTLRCSFLFLCVGYYDYAEGYTPEFAGRERFAGQVIHPQHWPEQLDYSGKRVIVIGSGATAVTLIPSLAKHAAHVTMLQRSPTYMFAAPGNDALANRLRKLFSPERAYAMVRWKNVFMGMAFFAWCRKFPQQAKAFLVDHMRQQLKGVETADLKRDFTPSYNPWDQRLCLVPEGDLFKALQAGTASVVTDHIDTFTERGIKLRSGKELEADLIITATGLKLKVLGGLALEVDGKPVEIPKTMTYKAMMLSDVPNMAYAMGYTNASWTLKCDLTAEYVCRLLNYMDQGGYAQCCPRSDPSVPEEEMLSFTSGYVLRSVQDFPRQGTRAPWRLYQNYARDWRMLRKASLRDSVMQFLRKPEARAEPEKPLRRGAPAPSLQR
jgi:cation diffusion facilitator CzcD-associated flavoprotein CzcO